MGAEHSATSGVPLEFTNAANCLEHCPGSLVLKQNLGGSRVLKSIKVRVGDRYDGVAQVYVKRRGASDSSLLPLIQVLESVRKRVPTLLLEVHNTPSAIVLLRPYFRHNLADRLHEHPYLSQIEHRWLAFQLLKQLQQLHESGVVHLSISSRNVMMNQWDWVSLTDVASYSKPAFLSPDNPAEYNKFYAHSQVRACYVAPERFCSRASSAPFARFNDGADDTETLKAADIFSLGCVIAEIFLEGKGFVFDHASLLGYRSGKFDPTPVINRIPDPEVRDLVLHMIQADPSLRLSSGEYLRMFSGLVFPSSFEFMYSTIFVPLTKSSALVYPDSRICYIHGRKSQIYEQISGCGDSKNVLSILISLLCFLLTRYECISRGFLALEMLHEFGACAEDQIRLSRVIPYTLYLITNSAKLKDNSMFQGYAIKLLTDTLHSVKNIDPSEAMLFSRFIFPSLAKVMKSAEEFTIVSFASGIGVLAESAARFLDMAHYLSQFNQTVGDKDLDLDKYRGDMYEAELTGLRTVVMDLVVNLAKVWSTTAVKVGLLGHVEWLAVFLGKHHVNSQLVPLLISMLNDQNPSVRTELLRRLGGVCLVSGTDSLHSHILPIIEAPLFDSEEFVVVRTLETLSGLCTLGIFEVDSWMGSPTDPSTHSISRILPMMCFPSLAIRTAALNLISMIADSLGPALAQIYLEPLMRPFTTAPIFSWDPDSLKCYLRSPISYNEYTSGVVSSSCDANFVALMEDAIRSIRTSAKDVDVFANSVDSSSLNLRFIERISPLPNNISGDTQTFPDHPHPISLSPGSSPTFTMSTIYRWIDRPHVQTLQQENTPTSAVLQALNAYHDFGIDYLSQSPTAERVCHPFEGDNLGYEGSLVWDVWKAHEGRINSISSSFDGFMMTTCSDDGTVKVWGSIVKEPKVTYTKQEGQIRDCVMCLDSFASASSDGSVHVCKVEYASTSVHDERLYSGCSRVKLINCESGGISSLTYGAGVLHSQLVCGGDQGLISTWDFRSKDSPLEMKLPRHYGGVSKLTTCDSIPFGLVSGTNLGYVTLWDLRFGALPLLKWRHSSKSPITILSTLPAHCSKRGSSDAPILLTATRATNQLLGMDLLDKSLVWAFVMDKKRTLGGFDTCGISNLPPLETYRHSISQQSNTAYQTSVYYDTVREQLVTSGTDRVVRCWELASPTTSYRMSTPRPLVPGTTEIASKDVYYSSTRLDTSGVVLEEHVVDPIGARTSISSSKVVSSVSLRTRKQSVDSWKHPILPFSAHEAGISAMDGIGGGLLATGSEDGNLKVWR